MTAYLDRLVDERTSLTGLMSSLRDKAAEADRDLDEAERVKIAGLQERCAQIDEQLTEHEAQMTSARAFAQLQSKIENGRGSNGLATRAPAPLEMTSFGQAFVESEQYRSYPGRGQGRAFTIADYLETRALITTSTVAVPTFVIPPKETQFSSPLLDLIGRVRVSSGSVEWVVVGADPVAAVVAEGAAKPEATLTFTPASATLDTLAHWVQITRQALEDASYMRSLIENKLRRGLLAKVAADAMATLAASTAINTATGTDLSAAIRQGIGEVEAAGYNANGILLNPADYADLDIAMAAITGTPDRRRNFWGVTTIADSAVTAGSAYVGDFNAGMTLFDRGTTDVFVTDSHASFFISNILVILAETRVKSAITEPLALCECTSA